MNKILPDNKKTIGIIAYLTLIGWIIALILHSKNKTEYSAFHLRQMLGIISVGIAIFLLNVVLYITINIGILGWIIQLSVFVFWLLGFLGAVEGKKKLVPFIGHTFQDWFKGIT